MKLGPLPRCRRLALGLSLGVMGLCGPFGCGAEHVVGSIGLGAPAFYPLAAIASLAVADFDGDGHPDIISQDRDGFTVCLLRGVGDGSLLPPECQQLADSSTVIAALPIPFGPALLLRAKSEVSRWKLGSSGRFFLIDKSPLPQNASSQGLTVADVDGDGRLDVLVTTTGPQPVSVLLSTETGFRSAGHYVLPAVPSAVLYQDVDGDHHPELAILLPDRLMVWGERGQAHWSGCSADGPQFSRPLGPWLVSLWMGGLPALMVFDASLGFLRVVRASPGTDFTLGCGEVAVLPGETAPAADVVAGTTTDLDGDGLTELLVASTGGGLRAFRGEAGRLAPCTELQLGTQVSSLAVGDLNHDELPEVIAVSERRDAILVVPNLFRR